MMGVVKVDIRENKRAGQQWLEQDSRLAPKLRLCDQIHAPSTGAKNLVGWFLTAAATIMPPFCYIKKQNTRLFICVCYFSAPGWSVREGPPCSPRLLCQGLPHYACRRHRPLPVRWNASTGYALPGERERTIGVQRGVGAAPLLPEASE